MACFVKYRKKYTICDLAQFSIFHLWSEHSSEQRLNPIVVQCDFLKSLSKKTTFVTYYYSWHGVSFEWNSKYGFYNCFNDLLLFLLHAKA